MQYDLLYEQEVAARYQERVKKAEEAYRLHAAGIGCPSLGERSARALGDLLIALGQRLKGNDGWRPHRPFATARR